MSVLQISKKDNKLYGAIRLPSSKSISNRALLINYLSGCLSDINKLSEADDTRLMQNLLHTIEETNPSNGFTELNCQNSGTVMRFLTALLSIKTGAWRLTGNGRMYQRPIGTLVEAIRRLGADIIYLGKEGYPPLQINGKTLIGGKLAIDSSISSQFISALLMVAPVLEDGLELILQGKISSKPYIDMTLGVLKKFGVQSEFTGQTIRIKNQPIRKKNITVEPDWSSAAFWYQMVAFSEKAEILLHGLRQESLQGDAILPEIYRSLGVKTEFKKEGARLIREGEIANQFEYDFTDCPDLAQSVIVTCAGLNIQGNFTGIESLRIKETDRLSALESELRKLGVECEVVSGSGFQISGFVARQLPITDYRSPIINTYGDHRMAMAFAPLAMIFSSIQIKDPEVISKSYPGFWEDLGGVGFIVE